MGKRLYGYAVKENVEYEWKSEPGACEVCQGMSGTIYDSANDIPDRPHPNCKCWIDILEKETDEPVSDPIEAHREKIKDRKRNELEIAKMLGDSKSLEQEIDEYIKRMNKQDKEIEKLENSVDTSKLNPKDRQKLSEAKEQINYTKYKSDNAKQKISSLKKEIETLKGGISQNHYDTDTLNKLDEIRFKLKILQEEIDNSIKKQFDKCIEAAEKLMPVSAALWKLSTSKFQEGLDYINKNGAIYNKIDDIKNEKVRDFVKKKVGEQMHTKDSRGVVFNSKSSFAKSITDSNAMKKFVKNNKEKFKPNAALIDTSLDFNILNPDMFNALHKADIMDIKIDKDGTFTAKVIDTYDFNKDSWNPLVRLAGHYQEEGKIENYYTITIIKIPQSEWSKY